MMSLYNTHKNDIKSSPELYAHLLKDVIAYVDVTSRGENCSDGVKALMRAMGATISEKITNEVTHVVYKEGSYYSFSKATLLNLPLVSVLWVQRVKSTKCQLPATSFPALCDYDTDLVLKYKDILDDLDDLGPHKE